MFVYGTLKRGQPNNHFIHDTESGHAEFVGTGHTTEQYPLVIAGKYNIPYLLYIPGQGYVSAVFIVFVVTNTEGISVLKTYFVQQPTVWHPMMLSSVFCSQFLPAVIAIDKAGF